MPKDLASIERGASVLDAHAAAREHVAGIVLQPSGEVSPAIDAAPLPKLIRASDVASQPISWLWPGWLAAGKLHVIGGAPGLAKTTIALDIAAIITSAGRWPDNRQCQTVGDVLIWSGEDSIADTLRPRLEAMGANLDRVHFVGAVTDVHGERPFDPATDARGLMRAIADLPSVKFLIVDPIVSAVAGDSHKNAEVRRGLQPLVELAEKLGIAVFGITHFSKGTAGREPLERLTGSLAFGALARLVFGVAKLKAEDGTEYRAIVRIKSNIGPDGGGFRYEVDYIDIGNDIIASRIKWGVAIEGAAREILSEDTATLDADEASATNDARQFLKSLLADGPMSAGAVFREADGAGFAKRTIQRAADRLEVVRHKDGMRGPWTWSLKGRCQAAPEGAVDDSHGSSAPSASSDNDAAAEQVHAK